MYQQSYEKLGDMARKIQEPFQAITELNIKTLQGLNYLKPEELAQIKKPEEFFEKQMKVAAENGQKTVEYMQKSFQILEKAMAGFMQDAKKATVADSKK